MKRFIILVLFIIGLSTRCLGQDVNVLTYNIRYDNPKDGLNSWNNRKDFLISQLNFYAPEVFGIQEGLKHQLDHIKDGMRDYNYIGVARDDGHEEGEYSAIYYNTKKIALIADSTFWLSKTPEKPSKDWDAALPRICTYGRFKIKRSDEQFYLFNTHFDHVGVEAREQSVKLILRKITEINTGGLPVILMGDFNLESGNSGIRSILNDLKDTHSSAGEPAHGPDGTFNGFDFTSPVKRKIDFIFVSDDWEVLKSAVLSDSKECRYPSDHFPVYTQLKFKH